MPSHQKRLRAPLLERGAAPKQLAVVQDGYAHSIMQWGTTRQLFRGRLHRRGAWGAGQCALCRTRMARAIRTGHFALNIPVFVENFACAKIVRKQTASSSNFDEELTLKHWSLKLFSSKAFFADSTILDTWQRAQSKHLWIQPCAGARRKSSVAPLPLTGVLPDPGFASNAPSVRKGCGMEEIVNATVFL